MSMEDWGSSSSAPESFPLSMLCIGPVNQSVSLHKRVLVLFRNFGAAYQELEGPTFPGR